MEEITTQIVLGFMQNIIASITVIISTVLAYYIVSRLREREKELFINFIKGHKLLRDIIYELRNISIQKRIIPYILTITYFFAYPFIGSTILNTIPIEDIERRDILYIASQGMIISMIVYLHSVFIGYEKKVKRISLKTEVLLNMFFKGTLLVHVMYSFLFVISYVYGILHYLSYGLPVSGQYLLTAIIAIMYSLATIFMYRSISWYDDLYFLERIYRKTTKKLDIQLRLINGNIVSGKLLKIKDFIIIKPHTDADSVEIIPYSKIISISLPKPESTPNTNKIEKTT